MQKGIDRVATTQTTAAIREAVDQSRYLLWAIYSRGRPLPLLAAAATYVRPTNKGRVAVIDTIGGHDMHEWLEPALAQFTELARGHGCTRIECENRPGFARKLPGFRMTRVILEKVL